MGPFSRMRESRGADLCPSHAVHRLGQHAKAEAAQVIVERLGRDADPRISPEDRLHQHRAGVFRGKQLCREAKLHHVARRRSGHHQRRERFEPQIRRTLFVSGAPHRGGERVDEALGGAPVFLGARAGLCRVRELGAALPVRGPVRSLAGRPAIVRDLALSAALEILGREQPEAAGAWAVQRVGGSHAEGKRASRLEREWHSLCAGRLRERLSYLRDPLNLLAASLRRAPSPPCAGRTLPGAWWDPFDGPHTGSGSRDPCLRARARRA